MFKLFYEEEIHFPGPNGLRMYFVLKKKRKEKKEIFWKKKKRKCKTKKEKNFFPPFHQRMMIYLGRNFFALAADGISHSYFFFFCSCFFHCSESLIDSGRSLYGYEKKWKFILYYILKNILRKKKEKKNGQILFTREINCARHYS